MVKGVLPFIQLYITNKMESFSFNSGLAVQIAKLIKLSEKFYQALGCKDVLKRRIKFVCIGMCSETLLKSLTCDIIEY